MNILESILLLFAMFFAFVILPVIVLAALWDIIAFIVFLATFRSNEEKHKNAENMFIKSSAVLTAGIFLTAVGCFLWNLIYNFI